MPWRFFSDVTFVLFCFVFRLYAFVEAAALRSIVLRYAGVPIATRVSFLFPYFVVYLEVSLFPSIFSAFSLYGEYAVRSLSLRIMVFFLPCDHGLDFLHQLM